MGLTWGPAPDGVNFQVLLTVPIPENPTLAVPVLVLLLDKAEANNLALSLEEFRSGLVSVKLLPPTLLRPRNGNGAV